MQMGCKAKKQYIALLCRVRKEENLPFIFLCHIKILIEGSEVKLFTLQLLNSRVLEMAVCSSTFPAVLHGHYWMPGSRGGGVGMEIMVSYAQQETLTQHYLKSTLWMSGMVKVMMVPTPQRDTTDGIS